MATQIQLTLKADVIEGTATVVASRTLTEDDTTVTEYLADTIVVPANSTDYLLTLAPVGTAKTLVLTFDNACSIKLNGTGNTSFAVAAGGLMTLAGFAITAVHVTVGATGVTVKRMAANGT